MLKSKRAIAVALASLGLLAAADLPTDFQTAGVQLKDAAPVTFTLQAEDLDYSMPVDTITPTVTVTDINDISLGTLVSNVKEYGLPEMDEEMRCLASAVYNEARGEPLEGQLAVAQVVLNRVADPRWPSSICNVVFQRSQFSFTFDGKPDYPARPNANWLRAEAVAVVAATDNWEDVTDEAVFFHATYVAPKWRRSFQKTADIGQHVFYR
ncbi:cell wall hydrolase [Pacificimonas sp. ICDLI1SI03]|jgi:spore germination cell wall hydrolase CwlJ-like protein|tara:strand:- start:4206 stop:4835 length:630 start_codon:yes stop_codon:yes gene_type:complete